MTFNAARKHCGGKFSSGPSGRTGLEPIGYKIGLELMVKCGPARIDEVPIAIEPRCHGTSKLTMRQRFEYLEHVARLYAYRYSWRGRDGRSVAAGQPEPPDFSH